MTGLKHQARAGKMSTVQEVPFDASETRSHRKPDVVQAKLTPKKRPPMRPKTLDFVDSAGSLRFSDMASFGVDVLSPADPGRPLRAGLLWKKPPGHLTRPTPVRRSGTEARVATGLGPGANSCALRGRSALRLQCSQNLTRRSCRQHRLGAARRWIYPHVLTSVEHAGGTGRPAHVHCDDRATARHDRPPH